MYIMDTKNHLSSKNEKKKKKRKGLTHSQMICLAPNSNKG